MSRYRFVVFAALSALATTACSDDEHFIVVTVAAQPAVHGAASLSVALTNAGTSRMDTLVLGDKSFPATFSISTPDRTGELGVRIEATDAGGLVVGRAVTTTTVEASDLDITLESVDFVVNTEFTGDQFTTDDFEASGFQLAALPDGTWTAAFRDGCVGDVCTVFARRFDLNGIPVRSEQAAGTNAFALSSEPTDFRTTAAIASGAATTVAVWDFGAGDGTLGVACRALDAAGVASSAQTRIALEDVDVVSLAALSDGNFAAFWMATPAENTTSMHAAIVKPDCTTVAPPVTLSNVADQASRGAVTSSADRILYAWIAGGALHVRLAMLSGAFITEDTVLLARSDTEEIAQARVAPAPDGGFFLAARVDPVGTGPGRIDLLRLGADGVAVGSPVLVSDRNSNDDNVESFGIAANPAGTALVVWHSCDAFGDGSRCGVFGRFHDRTGAALAAAFGIPTTTTSDQVRPSVVALPDAFVATWTDLSAAPPDISGVAIRARIIYSP